MHKGAVQAQHWCTAAASARRCSVVAPAASPAHKAQLTTALMAQGWCHESVDIATAQGAVQQLRATVPHRSSVAAAASVAIAASPVHKAHVDHRSALMAQAYWCEDSLPLYKVLCSTLSPGRRGSRVLHRGYVEGTSRVHRGYVEGTTRPGLSQQNLGSSCKAVSSLSCSLSVAPC